MDGALAVVECATWTVSEAGDHTIVVGQVCSCAPAVDAAGPLIFFGGGYGSIAPPPGVHAAGAPAGALTT